jgi:hypothetical protein
MNRRYWTRVALGALLVFGLGLAGLAAVNRGKAEVRTLLSNAAMQLPLQLARLDFSLDGRKIGTVSGIDVQRTDAADPGRVKLRVALADAGDLGRLETCRLTSDDLDRFPHTSGFRCADAAEIGAGLVEMGEVVFQPAELVAALSGEPHHRAVAPCRGAVARRLPDRRRAGRRDRARPVRAGQSTSRRGAGNLPARGR